MYSERFQDIYFQENGVEESEYVFLNGNGLKERFAAGGDFALCELGFGTGLNFLVTAKAFLELNKQGVLYYYSVEKYPLPPRVIEKELSRFSEIQKELARLVEILKKIYYPVNGFHTVYFHPRIRLTLLIGDVLDVLGQIPSSTQFDAWYLDGFDPRKNPEMWREEIYREMARLSYHGSTLATFSVSRMVREGLMGAGFHVNKIPGYNKKEMLTGYYNNPAKEKKISNEGKTVAVIGAGISGAITSFFLLKRGFRVLLFDSYPDMMLGASYIPLATVMPYISKSENELSSFLIRGLNFLFSLAGSFLPEDLWNGIFQRSIVITKKNKVEKMEHFLAGYGIPRHTIRKYREAYVDRKAGVLSVEPLRLFLKEKLMESENFSFHPGTEIQEVYRDDQWYLKDHRHRLYSGIDGIIYCNSYAMEQFPDMALTGLHKVRGQLIWFSRNYIRMKIRHSHVAEIAIHPWKEKIYLGSSYEPYLDTPHRVEESDTYILKKLQESCPELFSQIATATPEMEFLIPTGCFVGFRCHSQDYLPVIGSVPQWDNYIAYLNSLPRGGKYQYKDIPVPGDPERSVFVNTAHGSRGYSTSFLGGEILVSLLSHAPVPVEENILRMLSPARFVFRKWRSHPQRKNFKIN